MITYPQDQIYCIVPIQNFLSVSTIARKSLDGKFMVWHYLETDPALDKLKANVNIKLLSHAEALKLMAAKQWQKSMPDFFSSSNK